MYTACHRRLLEKYAQGGGQLATRPGQFGSAEFNATRGLGNSGQSFFWPEDNYTVEINARFLPHRAKKVFINLQSFKQKQDKIGYLIVSNTPPSGIRLPISRSALNCKSLNSKAMESLFFLASACKLNQAFLSRVDKNPAAIEKIPAEPPTC
jgi:hypothetical protein